VVRRLLTEQMRELKEKRLMKEESATMKKANA
jgi:hypothetical protein